MNKGNEKNTALNLSKIKFNEQTLVVTSGTVIGLLGRWLTWGLEYAMYVSSEKTNTKLLIKIYAELFNWKTFYNLNASFLRTGFTQTIGKSMSNIGVLHYVDCYYSYLGATSKGLLAACLSAPFETILTSRGEYRKIQSFYPISNYLHSQKNFLFPPGFKYVVSANFIRNLITGIITFVGIYKITELLKPLFPIAQSDSPMVKGISASLANIIIQPLNMPFINFQTYVLRNPTQPIRQAASSFFQEHTVFELFKGFPARTIHRGIFYGITLGVSTYLNSKQQTHSSNVFENKASDIKFKKL